MPEQKSFGAIPTAKQFNQTNFNIMKNSAEQITKDETQMSNSKETRFLTNEEKQSIKVLNFIATYDGIIDDEYEIKYLLKQGIQKFISKKNQGLVSITETAYPIRIKY